MVVESEAFTKGRENLARDIHIGDIIELVTDDKSSSHLDTYAGYVAFISEERIGLSVTRNTNARHGYVRYNSSSIMSNQTIIEIDRSSIERYRVFIRE